MTALSYRTVRAGVLALALGATAACASGAGNTIDSVLGALGTAVGGAGQGGQVQGVIAGVDTRAQQIGLQVNNGQQTQTVALAYDQQTTVTYQNQSYAVTNLEAGDRVTVTVQDKGNGNYYVSAVQVDQSASGAGANGGTASGSNVQSVQGVVRQVDVNNGLFSIDVGNGSAYTVSLPYNVSRADADRFRALRPGDRVRFYGVLLNNTRIELRQFY